MTSQRRMVLAGAVLAVLIASMLVVRLSSAAFTAATSNAGNSWETGTVTLTDDDSDAAMFAVSGMVPGQAVERCITVLYTGNVPADIRLYGSGMTETNDLADDLYVTVQLGTGGSFVDCDGFTHLSTFVSDQTLTTFASSWTSWESSVIQWTPSAPQSRTYRFVVTLDEDSTKQASSAGHHFVWEAQSRTW